MLNRERSNNSKKVLLKLKISNSFQIKRYDFILNLVKKSMLDPKLFPQQALFQESLTIF